MKRYEAKHETVGGWVLHNRSTIYDNEKKVDVSVRLGHPYIFMWPEHAEAFAAALNIGQMALDLATTEEKNKEKT